MYEQYWGLTEPPFTLTPNPRFLYLSEKHQNGLTMLLFAITRNKGAGMIAGAPGSGKTTLSRKLLEELPADKYRVAMIVNPRMTPVQLFREALIQFGVDNLARSKQELIQQLNTLLLSEYNQGIKTVLMVDEAHLIKNMDTFEELRLILNFQLNNEFLITLLLLGQPELMRIIDKNPALKQRLAVRFALEALNRAEMEEMIKFRMKAAWYIGPDVFAPDALDELYEYSGGLPRVVCEIADNALLMGMLKQTKKIDAFMMRSVIMDFEGKEW